MAKFEINEFGEIIREDYFFSSVKENIAQLLPYDRKVWKVYLLSLFTLGIYGIVVAFAMAKETNISCVDDGKHTRSFWPTLGLMIITFGIYGIVWYYNWLNREANYLESQGKDKRFTGAAYLGLFFLNIAINIASTLLPDISFVFSLLMIFVNILILTKIINQHNLVNKTYNTIYFGRKEQ
ncbi:MAG: DUF4234 domain-containing protein [Marinilabiliaceae bacterium]|nr:DUF4234 domain-containing protein [Marinilabiliaceae bacterium]